MKLRTCFTTQIRCSILSLCFLLSVTCPVFTAPGGAAELQPSLRSFQSRLEKSDKEIAVITRAAEAAAARVVAVPKTAIFTANLSFPVADRTPEQRQEDSSRWKGFMEELTSRAGGLANMPGAPRRSPEEKQQDIALIGVRSWAKDTENATGWVRQCKERGSLSIVFASQAGRPADLKPDYFIDNGAASADESEAGVNQLINCLNGWMWCCEYVAAMTRQGLCPGILKSALYPDGRDVNRKLQQGEGRYYTEECKTPVAAGQLARLYLTRTREMARTLASDATQKQVTDAAKLFAERSRAGNRIYLTGMGHLVMGEMHLNLTAPWVVTRSVGVPADKLKVQFGKGDAVLWIGYLGVNTRDYDFATPLDQTEADVILCIAPDVANPANNGPWAAGRVEQSWVFGDAEVAVPCPPGKMGPISGINAILLMRMVDDQVAANLKKIVG